MKAVPLVHVPSGDTKRETTVAENTLGHRFRKHLHPDTGQWVHRHPEKGKLKAIFERNHNV